MNTIFICLMFLGFTCNQGSNDNYKKPTEVIALDSLPKNRVVLSGQMIAARAAHTATLLNNGNVLICGGFAGNNTLSMAEIYYPASNTFKKITSMQTPRAGHSATLLPDGKVLIAGGYNGNYLSTTEVFDPQTEKFNPSTSMTMPRSGHTATILNNGRMLIAGGVGTGWSFLQSAELYDIRSTKFIATGSMTTARESHTATLLKNGTVLISGGHKGRRADIQIFSSAEIYDPSKERFTATGNMAIIRHKHDAVLLADGNVLVTGGSDQRDSRGVYRSAEIYDADLGVFKSARNMQLPHYKHNGTSILLGNGNILVAGGANQAELYHPGKNQFMLVEGNYKTQRLFSCATRLPNGDVLITGGYDEDQNTTNNAFLYRFGQ